ncbi:MAG: DDE-type integrase/transposase/recombinase [Clostridia bacterium]
MSTDAARQSTATFRFEVIAPLAVRQLRPGERAHIVRDLSGRLWKTPDGRTIRIHARTITRWLARYKARGYAGLMPEERADRGTRRVLGEQILTRAVSLRQEDPERSVLQIIRIMELEGLAELGTIKRTTLSEALCRAGVSRAEVTRNKQTFRLRESPYPNAMWQIDTCQIIKLPDAQGRRRTLHLVACLDDFSRHVVAHLYPADDRPALADLLKRAIIARGKPAQLYADNGSAYRSGMLATACAKLGIEPRHTRPYKPQGRGKVERFFRTAERQWGREAQALIDAERISTLDEVQCFFAAWLTEYNARVHSSTKEAPNTRLGLVHPDHPIIWVPPDVLADAFLWTQIRTVTAVGTISLEGHDFEVAPELAHRKITLCFDPYDLSRVLVEYDGRSYGVATPLGKLPAHSRHVRPPQDPAEPEPDRTRFDRLLTEHADAVAFEQAGHMRFHTEGGDGR